MILTHTFKPEQIAAICDHTFLDRTESYPKGGEGPVKRRQQDFFRFLTDVCQRELYAVCIRAEDVPHAFRFLKENAARNIPIVATVGFPEGSWYKTRYKLFETQYAMDEGASEIDMVLNYQALKEGEYGIILEETEEIRKIVHRFEGKLKLILETSELTNEQIAQACRLATHAGVDFVKTSTGFATHGVQEEKLAVMCRNFKGGIKISGGVNAENIQRFLSIISFSQREDFILDPRKVRIGESQLLDQLGS